jgi:hypothetical protein
VIDDQKTTQWKTELRLKAKIQKGINIKYLTRKQGHLSIHKSKLVGRFHGDCYEGWYFTLKFDDDME